MTIAACYVSPEGVVLAADSTSTYALPSGHHYYNYAQKLFEVGENSTIGIVTWGLGGLAVSSYRMLIANLADDLRQAPAQNLEDIANRWSDRFWARYSAILAADIQMCATLSAKEPFDPNAGVPNPNARTASEEKQLRDVQRASQVGFCIGGYALPDRTPRAYQMIFDATTGCPTPEALPLCGQRFWGAPNMIKRLMSGCDDGLRKAILESGKWLGTPSELDALIGQFELTHPIVPIRDAIDFTHACVHSTIKAIKFSAFPQICGGPIEIAVITADRRFRWVRHKAWDTAITEGDV